MRAFVRTCARILVLGLVMPSFGYLAHAQGQDHVVTPGDLKKDAAVPAQTREANEGAVRGLLSSEAGQKALKTTGMQYQQVDRAVSRLDAQELAKLSERARQAQADFAAGRISDRDLLWIILAILAIIIIALAVR
jgi:hypothetical protein